MCQLVSANFRAPLAARDGLRRFYGQALGFQLQRDDESRLCLRLEASPRSAGVDFAFTSPDVEEKAQYAGSRSSHYWKIGLAMHDVDAAFEALSASSGVRGGASQFLDVGYLGHIADPVGFPIELLQTTFQDNSRLRAQLVGAGAGSPRRNALGQTSEVVMGQITTRTADPALMLDFYQDVMGMKFLCLEPVEQYGFDLYFLGFTDEEPPNADRASLENREWLYQRPYTTLEIQHRRGCGALEGEPEAVGFESITVRVGSAELARLARHPSYLPPPPAADGAPDGGAGAVRDPDGILIRLVSG